MKKWNAPEVAELNIAETAGGFWKVGVEGPFNVVFGDKDGGTNDNNKNDGTTGTEEDNSL
ncbi:MAG: hypothetical protein IKL28_07990 [Lachnospiraceae bacterium]|nr:hypothetical protein [Lachnospiraceae bacterium]